MAEETWTKRILDWTRGYLAEKGDEHPRLSAEWLISNACGLSRIEIYTGFGRILTPKELAAMHDGVLRRGRGEPLQYVTGEMPFRHIILRCERGVLIPRPETEILVDAALHPVSAGDGFSAWMRPRLQVTVPRCSRSVAAPAASVAPSPRSGRVCT